MANVQMKTSCSTHVDPVSAAEEALGKLGQDPIKLALAFVPGCYEHAPYHDALRARLPKDTQLVSCSSGGGELTNAGYLENTLVVTALAGDLDVGVGYAKGISRDAVAAGASAIEAASRQLGVRVQDMDRRYGVIVIDDGIRMKKEELLIGIHERNQGLVSVGGGAGGYRFMQDPGFIGVNGETFMDGVVTIAFKTDAKWDALRSHWYKPTGKLIELTKVDVVNRRILEIDGKSAGQRLAELMDVPPEYLTMNRVDELLRWSLAMRVGREYFNRAIIKSAEDDSLQSVNMVQEGLELEIMRIGDMVEMTRNFFQNEIPERVPNPTGALLFDCGTRRMSGKIFGNLDQLSETLKLAPPCAGLTVEFETYCGFMINSTATSVIFGMS